MLRSVIAFACPRVGKFSLYCEGLSKISNLSLLVQYLADTFLLIKAFLRLGRLPKMNNVRILSLRSKHTESQQPRYVSEQSLLKMLSGRIFTHGEQHRRQLYTG